MNQEIKRKWINLIIFIFSGIALLISLRLFCNMGIYVDEYNTSPTAVCGGEFWLYMDWLRLVLLAIVTMVSGIKVFVNKN